jgi:thymidylate synthase (FAD)
MDAQFIAKSHINPAALDHPDLQVLKDPAGPDGQLRFSSRVLSTLQETILAEYPARVCYESVDKLGLAPDFIKGRISEEHLDTIEHTYATQYIEGAFAIQLTELLNANRHLAISIDGNPHDGYVTANLRAWRDLLKELAVFDMQEPLRKRLAERFPQIFYDFRRPGDEMPSRHHASSLMGASVPAIRVGQATVTMLALHYHDERLWTVNGNGLYHGAATFLIEGVSRALTHQLVRSRLLSFSQVSQRYCDLAKGEWNAIIPPAIAADPSAQAIMDEAWQYLEAKYIALREKGIRKEDARFLLPNACESRIVVSGPFSAWTPLLWQRAVDKAAQWEFRGVAQAILCQLYQVAPTEFTKLWTAYNKMSEPVRVQLG